jgi:predicted  nucleic acid-binding Zn-ribbon protein
VAVESAKDDADSTKTAFDKLSTQSGTLQSAIDKISNPTKIVTSRFGELKSQLEPIAHPIQTIQAGVESLKGKLETIVHPVKAFQDKLQSLKDKMAQQADAAESAKNKLSYLQSSYDSAKGKVDSLTQQFNASIKSTGALSDETKALAEKLAEAEKEADQAKRSLNSCAEEINSTGNEAEQSAEKTEKLNDKMSKIGSAVKGGLLTAAKVGVAAIGAAAAGVSALVKASVDSYADYEQLVGGVETLFKDSAGVVEQYAANAYSAAGLSANEYMDTVTSFSASLLQGLGGDTAKAAEIANQAVVDMSDNANKMGTDMASIQYAYQGFAKQNYTMLDNLKLGYGGTASEMARLINDSGVLGDSITVTADTVNDVSFDKMIEAIHVVQDNLGITGTTAKEAATTIQGSVSAMKASWQNLLTGVADDTQDFDLLVTNFVDSVGTVADNILPRIETALNGVGKLVEKLAPIITERLPGIVESVLPVLISAAESLLNGVVEAIPGLLNALIAVAPMVLETIVNAFGEYAPMLIDAALQLIVSLGDFLGDSLPELIPAIVDIVLQIAETLINNIDKLIDPALKIIVALAEGLINALPRLVEKAPTIITKLIQAIVQQLPNVLNTGIEVLGSLISGILSAIPSLVAAIPGLINSFVSGITGLLGSVVNVGEKIVDSIKQGISNAWEGLKSWFSGIWDGLFGNKKVNVSVNKSGTAGSHAGGLDYVPYNDYVANLHRGEMVLTAPEADAYRKNERKSSGGVTVVQNIYSKAQTAADLMREAKWEQERAVMMGV